MSLFKVQYWGQRTMLTLHIYFQKINVQTNLWSEPAVVAERLGLIYGWHALGHLELHSRAAPSVESHHHVNGPDTGRNYGGRRIIKKHFGQEFKRSFHFPFITRVSMQLSFFTLASKLVFGMAALPFPWNGNLVVLGLLPSYCEFHPCPNQPISSAIKSKPPYKATSHKAIPLFNYRYVYSSQIKK